MALFSLSSWYIPGNRSRALVISSVLVVSIALADYSIRGPIGMGNLYLFPIIIAAGFLVPWQIVLLAVICMILRETMVSTNKQIVDMVPRMFLSFTGYVGTGFFVREVVRNRQKVVENLAQLQEQVKLREDAEEQLRVLVESSPAAIIIVDSEGCVLASNQAADRLLQPVPEGLRGERISRFFPVLGAVPRGEQNRPPFRTKIETRGRRGDGEVFPAHVWLSTYNTHSGGRLAAIILDASEDLREREEEGLHRLLSQSHIVAGAVWHEVRNLCAAISVVHANLRREGPPEMNMGADFQALGNLVEGLKNLASGELRPRGDVASEEVDLREVLDDLRIIVGAQFAEADADLGIEVAPDVGFVIAQRYSLLQVFMNLAQNALRAIRQESERRLTIRAAMEQDRVVIRFRDTGRGVRDPNSLFQPFQRSAEVTGLGLYVSRAMLRDFLGELIYEPQERGSCFVVAVSPARSAERARLAGASFAAASSPER